MADIVQISKGGKKFYPQTHVQAVLGLNSVGTNLIVQSGLKSGYLNRDDGSTTGGGSDFHSDNYIATNGETVFTFSSPDYVFKGSGNHSLAMYDSDKNYLGYQSITSPTQTLSKSNAAYIRFSINLVEEGGTTNNLSDWLDNHRYKLEKGSIATDYSLNPLDISTSADVQAEVTKQIKVNQPDLSGFQKASDVQNAITSALGKIDVSQTMNDSTRNKLQNMNKEVGS